MLGLAYHQGACFAEMLSVGEHLQLHRLALWERIDPRKCSNTDGCLCCGCRLRWVKSASELSLMRTSANIAGHAQRRCMQLSHAGVQERALATEFEYSIKMAGASRLAYPTMAGGGADTCTIHYGRNDKRVRLNPATVPGGQLSARATHWFVIQVAGCRSLAAGSGMTVCVLFWKAGL